MLRRLVPLVSIWLAIADPTRVLAQRCEAPRVMLTVDRSSSMLGTLPDGTTKWDAAVMAIGEIASSYESGVAFGMQPFPYPDRCEPGRVVLAPGAHTSAALLEAMGAPPPSGGNWTPIAQTLEAAAMEPTMRDESRTRHLILVTDGWQWCDPYAPSTRFTPVESVTRLRALGVTVHVVGFGAGVDSLTLNRAALAAGTALPGCDADAAAPRDPNHCYAQADDLAGLRAALEAIARVITEEVCDGEDDDCDGRIDEGYDADTDAHTICGTREAGGVDPALADCDDAEPRVHPGASEVCDLLDNDCDGVIDPDCGCAIGDRLPCGSDVGACQSGLRRCAGGAWGACDGEIAPAVEVCDGEDDDCDGAIDEDADASCGEGELCTADRCISRMPADLDAGALPPMEGVRDAGTPPRRRGMQAGCACATSAPRASGAGALLVAGMVLVGIMRSRHRSLLRSTRWPSARSAEVE